MPLLASLTRRRTTASGVDEATLIQPIRSANITIYILLIPFFIAILTIGASMILTLAFFSPEKPLPFVFYTPEKDKSDM